MTSEAQIEQVAQMLKIMLRLARIQNQALEKKLGFSGGYMSRLLSGKIDIKISHVLDLAEALEMYPYELFAIAVPPAHRGPSAGLLRVLKALPHLVPALLAPTAASAPLDLERLHQELETGITEVLRRVFAELSREQAAGSGERAAR